MISLARRDAASQDLKPPHVSFVQASPFESLPVVSDSVDCVLSGCIINFLSPTGKASLVREVYRTLRPGGRLNVNDVRTVNFPRIFHSRGRGKQKLIAKTLLPDNIRNDLMANINCVSGAITIQEYNQLLWEAGFQGRK